MTRCVMNSSSLLVYFRHIESRPALTPADLLKFNTDAVLFISVLLAGREHHITPLPFTNINQQGSHSQVSLNLLQQQTNPVDSCLSQQS